MSKKSGKWAVLAIFGGVLFLSLLAFVVQQRIFKDKGKPVPAAEGGL